VIAHNHFSLFVQPAQNPAEGERGTETITVGPDVRGDGAALMFFDQFNNLA
jgi:hypothetical protein